MQLLCIREGGHARAFSARQVIICLRALNAENRILYGDCRCSPGALKRVKCLLKWLSFVRVRGAATTSAPGRLPPPSLARARYYYYKEESAAHK